MPRNRRNSSGVSYKSAIGFGCLQLLLTCTIVVFCVTKVIIGGEFISACPVEPLLPVYVVISGCLPVFLSPLRESVDAGDNRYDNKLCRMSKYAKSVLVIGIVSNGAWLIFGTLLITRVFSIDDSVYSNCEPNKYTNETHINSTNGTSIQDLPMVNNSTNAQFINKVPDVASGTTRPPGVAHISNIQSQVTTSMTKKMLFTESRVDARKSSEDAVLTLSPFTLQPTKQVPPTKNVSTESSEIQKVPNDMDSRAHETSINRPFSTKVTPHLQTKDKLSENNDTIGDAEIAPERSTLTNVHVPECVNCNGVLLRFAVAVVSIDWLCVICGIGISLVTIRSLCKVSMSFPGIT